MRIIEREDLTMNDLKSLRASKGLVKCRQCGMNNPKTSRTCRQCGQKLPQVSSTKTDDSQAKAALRSREGKTLSVNAEGVVQQRPLEVGNLSMLALLVEEEKQKKKRARFITGVMVASCLTGTIGGYAWYEQRDLREAKLAYANEKFDVLQTLKKEMDEEDWQRFEASQVSAIMKQVENVKKGKQSPEEVLLKIKQLATVIDDLSLKTTLKECDQVIQQVIGDDQAYQEGLLALTNGDVLTAYKSFLKVTDQSQKASEVQQRLKELQEEALGLWRVDLQQGLEQKQYERVVEESALYLTIKPKDANMVALKKQAEQQLAKQPDKSTTPTEEGLNDKPPLTTENEETVSMVEQIQAEEMLKEKEEKPLKDQQISKEDSTEQQDSTPEAGSDLKDTVQEDEVQIDYKTLKNEQTIKVGTAKLHFKLNRLTQTLWPDQMTSNSNVYQAEDGRVYFVYLFGVTNQGKDNLKLKELVQNATVTDGDGQTFKGMSAYYTKTKETLSSVDDKTVLKPGKSTTMHVVIPVPKELKTKVTPLTARIQINNQWYQKDIPAQ